MVTCLGVWKEVRSRRKITSVNALMASSQTKNEHASSWKPLFLADVLAFFFDDCSEEANNVLRVGNCLQLLG